MSLWTRFDVSFHRIDWHLIMWHSFPRPYRSPEKKESLRVTNIPIVGNIWHKRYAVMNHLIWCPRRRIISLELQCSCSTERRPIWAWSSADKNLKSYKNKIISSDLRRYKPRLWCLMGLGPISIYSPTARIKCTCPTHTDSPNPQFRGMLYCSWRFSCRGKASKRCLCADISNKILIKNKNL